MPRYYFHLINGGVEADREGIDLPSVDAARHAAVIYAGETLKDQPETVSGRRDLRIEVTDEEQKRIFMLNVQATDLVSEE